MEGNESDRIKLNCAFPFIVISFFFAAWKLIIIDKLVLIMTVHLDYVSAALLFSHFSLISRSAHFLNLRENNRCVCIGVVKNLSHLRSDSKNNNSKIPKIQFFCVQNRYAATTFLFSVTWQVLYSMASPVRVRKTKRTLYVRQFNVPKLHLWKLIYYSISSSVTISPNYWNWKSCFFLFSWVKFSTCCSNSGQLRPKNGFVKPQNIK